MVGFGLLFAGAWLRPSLNNELSYTNAADKARTVPLAVPRNVEYELPQPSTELTGLLNSTKSPRLPVEEGLSPSLCLHLMKIRGIHAKLALGPEEATETVSLINVIFDKRLGTKHFGRPALVETRYGLRFPTFEYGYGHRSDESHRDQCLAMLAELGIPLSYSFTFNDKAFTLRDVLRDSIANFHLEQEELPWSAVAYALYLPPERSWTNRFGMHISFDNVVHALMKRPLANASCGGSHLFYALTILARADQQHPILSPEVRVETWEHLRRLVHLAARCQSRDGSWGSGWHQALHVSPEDSSPPVSVDTGDRLVITGHLSEWMLYLPEQLAVPESLLRRSSFWLSAHLDATSEEQFWDNVCPFTHAICTVRPGS